MRRIRIGLIGCSSIAYRSVLPAIAANDRFEVAAIGSRSIEKAQGFVGEFGGRASTYEGVIDDESIDAIYLSLPVGLHSVWAHRALESRKHLLVEKTFTHSEVTAASLVEEGKQNQLVVMEALTYVYHPLFGQVRSIANSGSLGGAAPRRSSLWFSPSSGNGYPKSSPTWWWRNPGRTHLPTEFLPIYSRLSV